MSGWCKSKGVVIDVGWYRMKSGAMVEVMRSKQGRYYARDQNLNYQSGLIYRLQAELEAGTAERVHKEEG